MTYFILYHSSSHHRAQSICGHACMSYPCARKTAQHLPKTRLLFVVFDRHTPNSWSALTQSCARIRHSDPIETDFRFSCVFCTDYLLRCTVPISTSSSQTLVTRLTLLLQRKPCIVCHACLFFSLYFFPLSFYQLRISPTLEKRLEA